MKTITKICFIICFMFSFNCFAEDLAAFSDLENSGEQQVEEKPLLKIKDTRNINKANIAVIEGLNKITAKSYKYNVKIGDTINFERLNIQPLFCWKSSPDQVSENKVLLRIIEKSVNGDRREIFYGWMFSSSPSASSMEHPMYDVRVVDCLRDVENNN